MPINFLCDKILDMGEGGTVVEQQPKPNVTELKPEQFQKQNAGFSSKLAEIRAHARKAAWLPIDQEVQELDSGKGILKIPVVLARILLDKQKKKIQRQLEQPDKIQPESQRLPPYKKEKPLRQTEKGTLLAVGEEIRTIINDYEQLVQEIIQEGTVPKEIRDAYIQEVISPEADRVARNTNLTPFQKDEFYTALHAYLEHKDEPDPINQPYKKDLDRFIKDDYHLKNSCKPLFDSSDAAVIQHLVAKMAASDIETIKTSVLLQLRNNSSKEKFSDIFVDIIRELPNPPMIPTRVTFPTYLRLLYQRKIIPDMPFWQALKSSRTANEIFGKVIEDQDQENYATALNVSLSDKSEWSDRTMLLSYYPTPDAIRNLVVLAANGKRSISVNASYTLKNLTRRADWKDILSKAEGVYPSLKTVGTLLSESKYFDSSDGYRHEIVEESQDLILSIVENSESAPKLRELSVKTLTAHSILGILNKRGIIQASEVTMLNKIIEQPYGDYRFNGLKENLFELMQADETTDRVAQRLEIIGRFEMLSRMTLENESNHQALVYLQDNKVIKKLQDISLKQEDVNTFLDAYKTVPALTNKLGELNYYELNYELYWEFVKQFKGSETIQLFNDLSTAYSSFPDQLINIIKLVGESGISRERALELPTKAGDIINTPIFDLAMKFPDIFLQTDEALGLLRKFDDGSGFLDPSVNSLLMQGMFKRAGDLSLSLEGINRQKPYSALLDIEFARIDELLTANPNLEINENSWRSFLMAFVQIQTGNFRFSEQSRSRIEELFKNSRVRDFCLNNFRKEYIGYLANGNLDQIPFGLYLNTEMIKYAGGAGPLTQIESLSSFFNKFCVSLGKEIITEESRNKIFQRMHAVEIRFVNEKWSNEDKTNFYNISSDILTADPNLFSEYLELFENLNPSDLKRFMREIYPLYGVQLALMEKTDEDGKKTYDAVQLVNLRKDVQVFAESLKTQEKPLEAQKAKLIGEISRSFKDRFGITKIPKEFTEENIRSLTNVSTYLANIQGRNTTKETELGYYLSLMLNDRWDDFRKGSAIDPKEFLDPKKADEMTGIMERRTVLNPLTPENLGLQESDVPEFLRILQEEAQNVAVGDIETIDVKLNNVILNLRQLEDPDLYPEPLDKERMRLLMNYGNRKVGSVAAKMYQALQGTSRSIQFSDEELKIQGEIRKIAQDGDFELTADNIKKHFQDGIRPLSTIVNVLQFVDETHAELEIENIRQLLQPSQEIIDVFNRLGEEFQPTSGALALSQDLDYLDNIIVKKEDSLNLNERTLLVGYTGRIRGQVVKLQEIFDKIKDKFSSLKQGSTATDNQLLTDKLGQIDKIINAPSAQQTIVSTMTNNLNTIIENMRACLSCTAKGGNNDTNLTFGDSNKFYLYSQSEGQTKGSISDEILFLEPVTHQDGTSEMAFVFDRIYGIQTPTILTNQLETVIKKYRQLKPRYPKAKLSIFVTDSAIATAGLSQDMLTSRIQKTMGSNAYIKEEQVEVNVAESAMANHYIEFGGNSRSSGKRNVKGIVIRL